jgi:tetratricopeptide (TPR) repeat protein
VFVVAAVLALGGCGGGGAGGDVKRAYEKADYKDAVALGRHAIRTGHETPALHLYYGLSQVALGRDHEGFDEIDHAVAGDHKLAAQAASALWEMAQSKPGSEVSARRMWKASQLSPTIDLGRHRFAVANVCFGERDYASASKLYDAATHAYPDTAACEEAYAHLAECWKELGDTSRARQAMETLIARYPHGLLADRASARLDDITFDEAQQAYDTGDFDKAIELAKDLAGRTENRSLQQQARFLLGQSYEARSDIPDAYATYNEIVHSDRGDSGRVVERARARIEALQEAGLQ